MMGEGVPPAGVSAPSMTEEEFEERAILHALGVLNLAERARFEAEREARGEQGERIVRSARRAAARANAEPGASGPAEREALAAVTESPLRREIPTGWLAAVAVLAVLLLAALAWGLHERGRAAELEAARRAAAARADSLASLATARDSLVAARPSMDELLPVLAAPDLVNLPLSGEGGAAGQFLASGEGVLITARGLLPLSEGLTYQLWREGPTGPAAIARLGSAPGGRLLSILPDAGSLDGWGALVVTVEPLRGGTGPTGATVLQYRGRLR